MTDFPVEDEQRIRAEIGDNPTDLAARIYELEQKLELAGRSVIQAREACVWWADEYRTAESRATTAERKVKEITKECDDAWEDGELAMKAGAIMTQRAIAAESRATTAEQNDALSMAMRTYLENKLARAESHLSTTRSALERIAEDEHDFYHDSEYAKGLQPEGKHHSECTPCIARAALKELE